ncbi:hypothetical protein [Brevibacillus fulvus]|uniref:Uncharacterized protein n=1 Tax=Brevibacillus fulvus TaxID=1125967 RepID=A0A938XU17_9BACL|nr:hypothetical protein [Brevibacillus fulvus]MBM7590483.1 hypothetical protein [Brevibacillus fulvus]
MRKDRLEEEKLLVNGKIGGNHLSQQERQTLRREAAELDQAMQRAKDEPIAE